MNSEFGGTWEETVGIFLEDMRKTTQYFGHDSRSSGRDLNQVPPEYAAGVLTTRL
jgi:hypothetical protein